MTNRIKNLAALGAGFALTAAGFVFATQPAQAEVDIYITPGNHNVNNRQWRTTCEPYSQTERCRTEIMATVVKYEDGKFVQTTDWAFNNLTYKASPRSLWAGNPLGYTGAWTATDGRKWRTECDTPATGRGGCRSYIEADVIASTPGGYEWQRQWIFNNMVRFSTPGTPGPTGPSDPSEVKGIDLDLIVDANLRECIEAAIAADTVVDATVDLTVLDCSGLGIVSLEGLDQLTGLVDLNLGGNAIVDLSVLKSLVDLEVLDLSNNSIVELSALDGLVKLDVLNLSGNDITNPSALVTLTGLTTLDLSDNEIPLALRAVLDVLVALGVNIIWT
ncbi:hypothetical protein GCM10025789_10990 [Tessaracoccus lubricantis]|uniref:Leucine-rich repeat domain-containing protein n=1 Tax=Tessaracoccus lubricantis TaxID=545543 RepID=A0ABP9F6D0_9ACTN